MKLLIDECLSTELTKRAQPTSAQCGGKHTVGQLQWFIPPRELSLELKKQEEIRTHLDHAAGSFGCIHFAYRGDAAATIGGRAVGMKHYQHWPDLRPDITCIPFGIIDYMIVIRRGHENTTRGRASEAERRQ